MLGCEAQSCDPRTYPIQDLGYKDKNTWPVPGKVSARRQGQINSKPCGPKAEAGLGPRPFWQGTPSGRPASCWRRPLSPGVVGDVCHGSRGGGVALRSGADQAERVGDGDLGGRRWARGSLGLHGGLDTWQRAETRHVSARRERETFAHLQRRRGPVLEGGFQSTSPPTRPKCLAQGSKDAPPCAPTFQEPPRRWAEGRHVSGTSSLPSPTDHLARDATLCGVRGSAFHQ